MAGDPVTAGSSTTARSSFPARDTELLQWADQHCPKGAAAIRAADSPEELARCHDKLEGLMISWMFGQMTAAQGWDQQMATAVIRAADQLEAEGQTPRQAARNAFTAAQEAHGRVKP